MNSHALDEIRELAGAVAVPDLALCESCRGELLDPNNRRYRYPFINCANCGPRGSITHRLPYARANSTMRGFSMCRACEREYHDPLDRRFHAEANACPVCGPHVALWARSGMIVAERDVAMTAAANAVRAGRVVAVKSAGGFQWLVDAADEAAVQRLRTHGPRDQRPYVVMCPDLECVQQHARVDADEAQLLASREAPTVLVTARQDLPCALAPSVTRGSRELGVRLPSTPLHLLLMRDLRRPVVVASADARASQVVDERDRVARLGDSADLFLVHNRPIARLVPDTVLRIVHGRIEPAPVFGDAP